VFVGAGLLGTYDFINGGLHFALTDPLGTKRVQVSGTGLGELNCLSLPFGNNFGNTRATDCIPAPGGATAADATEHHFTGKERDSESGNDYFDARYYSSTMGRFLSPDWSAKEEPVPYANLENPQTLNLYAYVQNNPLLKPDLDGHGCPPDCSTGNPVIDFLGGAANAFGSDNLLGAGRVNQTTGAGQLGQAFGDFGAAAVGAGEFVVGTGGNVAGLALDATGVGALVGVPANVVSTAAMVQGGAAAVEGVTHLAMGNGSYTNTHASGKTYDGKGDETRAKASGARVEKETGDKHVSTEHTTAANGRESFKDESRRLDSHGGAGSDQNHNKIESPGKKYRQQDGSN
jgi:RHS repeat-associated protein